MGSWPKHETTDGVLSIVWRIVFILMTENSAFTVRAEDEGQTARILVRAEKRDMANIIGRYANSV